MTPEQQKAIALANARRRAAEAQQVAPEATTEDPGFDFQGALNTFARGASFGFADELAGAVSAMTGGDYESARDAWNRKQEQFAEANPATAAGVELVGGLMSGAPAAKAITALDRIRGASQLVSRAPQWVRMAGAGAAPGALYGAGTAEEGERIEGAAVGSTIGAVTGAAAPAALRTAGRAIGKVTGRGTANKAAQQAQNAVRDATMQAGKDAGYVVSPANANPTAWNRLLQGLAGKTASGQRAAMLNQSTTNRLARESLGLPDDAPLIPETFSAVRKAAGQAYEALRNFDDIAFDAQYFDDIAKAAKPYADTAKELPELVSKEAESVIQMAQREGMSGNGMIAATKLLRDRAKAAYRAGENELGRLYRGVSDAMEAAAERFIESTGDDATAQAFRTARETIAKAHTLENALNPSTGNIIASKIGQQMNRGTPATGQIKAIGQFARAFPRETQEISNSSWLQMPGPSPLDYAAGVGTALATGDPTGLSLVAARPLANALLTSRPYQSLMTTPGYAPGLAARAGQALRAIPKTAPSAFNAGLAGEILLQP